MKNQNTQQKNNRSRINLIKLPLALLTGVFILSINFHVALASPIESNILINLTNKSRMENGGNPLKTNVKLTIAAQNKANNMLENDYFEHYSPFGLSPWGFIHSAGYEYVMAGENLAMDFATSEGVHNAWMASESHKNNLLRSDYEEIGIATVKGEFDGRETTMIVQMFGKQMKNTGAVNNILWKISNWLFGY